MLYIVIKRKKPRSINKPGERVTIGQNKYQINFFYVILVIWMGISNTLQMFVNNVINIKQIY